MFSKKVLPDRILQKDSLSGPRYFASKMFILPEERRQVTQFAGFAESTHLFFEEEM